MIYEPRRGVNGGLGEGGGERSLPFFPYYPSLCADTQATLPLHCESDEKNFVPTLIFVFQVRFVYYLPILYTDLDFYESTSSSTTSTFVYWF